MKYLTTLFSFLLWFVFAVSPIQKTYACSPPSNLEIITNNDTAEVSWDPTPAAIGYMVTYKKVLPTIVETYFTTDHFYSLNGLQSGVFIIEVETICNNLIPTNPRKGKHDLIVIDDNEVMLEVDSIKNTSCIGEPPLQDEHQTYRIETESPNSCANETINPVVECDNIWGFPLLPQMQRYLMTVEIIAADGTNFVSSFFFEFNGQDSIHLLTNEDYGNTPQIVNNAMVLDIENQHFYEILFSQEAFSIQMDPTNVIDFNINLTTICECEIPTVTDVDIASGNAAVFWTNVTDAQAYELRYKEINASDWISGVQSDINSTVITGLLNGLTYEVQVRSLLTSGPSFWSPSYTFLFSSCSTVANQEALLISGNVVKLIWEGNSDAERYRIRYRLLGGAWVEALTAGIETFRFLNGLFPNTTYEFQLKSLCSNENATWSASNTFTTLSTICDHPQNIGTTSIGATTATVVWSIHPDDTKYKLKYKTTGESWTTISTSMNSFDMTNLVPAKTYKYKVKVKCAVDWTNWTANNTFTTAPNLENNISARKKADSSVQLFPNPAKERLHIICQEYSFLQVNDIYGKLIFHSTTPQSSIDISTYPIGIYFITVFTENDQTTKRFIKE